MPNTPALVGPGVADRAGTHATDEHLDLADGLLGAVGIVVRVAERPSTPSPAFRVRARLTCSSLPRR